MGAAYTHRPGFAAGVSAYAGLRFTHGADAHHYEGGLIFGERWGADVRAHAWRDAAARAVDASSLALGVAPTLHNVFGDFGASKGRGPALFGVLLPELGWAYRPRSRDSLYTVHTVPLACFLRDGFMLEAAGKAWVFYGSDVGPSEAMLSLTISVLYRDR
ncbi:MAG TPA: hypothetical protein VFS00_18960 [Polyangiaceae bacterium]|nr:hypothetical protein [Polyangiaceae bacterium]